MQRTFGAAAADVAITASSTRPLAAGAEGVAVGEQVYIAPGFYDLTTTEGRERLGHEVAHALQQRRGRDLPAQLGPGERAGLEAEADRAGQAFARGKPFAVQGRAPAQVALFKGAAPAKAPTATTTTIDLKAGGRIERKPPASDPAAGGAPAPDAATKDKPKAKEQVIITYGAVQVSNPFTVVRNESGEVVKLTGGGKLSLPASKYMKKLDLVVSVGPDGSVGAKMQGSSRSTITIGGLTVQGGTLTAAIQHGQLTYALDAANISLPRNIGHGALSIQGNGDQEPAFDASLVINVPKLQAATMSFHADASGYRATGSTGVDIKSVSGNVTFGLEKVGDDKALWSAAGSVGYNSERLSGQVSVQYNADGELSGEGELDFKIADFLTGRANVAVDKVGHVTVNGEIRPPAETQLFPEKKLEQTFFRKSLEFPIWGISIPMVGSVGIIAFIEGSMGYRVGVGAGVMRNIVLSGQYSTDPNVQPTFGITGEIFIPAFAELLISVGGGIKLSAFIAEVGGGVRVDGRAGFYGGLSVRPTLAYEGGKYRLTGQAILAGDVGLSAQVDAFVRLHVGKWMFSWEKEWTWKLAEWNKWLGLNLGMEADLDYTLGQPLSPDIFKLKKPDSIDVMDIAKSAMPQGGMPPQGPKGAQNQRNEFKQKGGGGAAASPSATAQPKVAGTPAGAAGHKNQDPKGTKAKPAKPPRSGPARPAKGKGPNQTGPNPKNKSKPTEPKLDAKPVIERFSMHGEPHQLIVQLGPGGHVDMASKRERLSVKVGNAVGKLIARHASPEQVSDLKAIGATAKRGDKMVATAKTTDKPGTTQVAHQIAAYGNKWQVKDLDEVAIKAPRSLVVPKPLQIKEPGEALAKALAAAKTGQIIFNKPGDPKQVARQVLEKHNDARFEFNSAKLTLPSPNPAQLATANSVSLVGTLLAQQTGVARITVDTTDDKGDTRVQFTGTIGASGTLGTVTIKGEVPKTLTIPGHAKIDKPTDGLSEDIAKATSGATAWQGSVTDPRQVTANLLRAHSDARFDRVTKNLQLPAVKVTALSAATSLAQLGQMLGDQTGVSKVTVGIADDQVELLGHINPIVKEVGVEDEPWLKAVKKAVGAAKGVELSSRLTKPTLKKLWETLGEQPFKDLVAAFPVADDIKDLVGAFGVAKLKAVVDEIAAADLASLKRDLTLQILKSLITALTTTTLKDLIAATDVATVVALARGLPVKDLKSLVAAFPPADLKTFIDRLAVPGLIEIADKIGVSTLSRAKSHFGGTPMLLDVLDAAKAATTTAVLKDLLAACFKNGFKTVPEITQFFAHISGLSEAQVRATIHGAELFVNESTGNMTAHGGRTTPDPSAPVQKQFVVQGGMKITLTFNAIDVQHILSRHTWAGFAMIPSNQAVRDYNTMFPSGTTDTDLWQWGRDIMNCADLVALMGTMTPGQSVTDISVNASGTFKINVNLGAPCGLVSFYAGGAGALNLLKAQMKAAIRLWMSK